MLKSLRIGSVVLTLIARCVNGDTVTFGTLESETVVNEVTWVVGCNTCVAMGKFASACHLVMIEWMYSFVRAAELNSDWVKLE